MPVNLNRRYKSNSRRYFAGIVRKNSTIVLFFFFHCLCSLSYAQNYPVYNHFYMNPYLYNPAEAGNALRPAIFVNHRQQWRGVEGAPVVSTLSFHTPFNRSNARAGLNISSFERGLLTTLDAHLTYGYAIPISPESSFRLALSAGLISHSIDFSQVDNPDDPALVNFLNNNQQLAGKFGVKYQSNGLNIGIALPQLFAPDYINTASFENYRLNPFDEVVFMVYYKKRADAYFKTKRRGRARYTKKVEAQYAPLELHFLYRYAKAGNNQFEALAKLNLSQAFWVGASFRQGYGITGNLGFNFSKFTLAYAYEPASKLVNGPFDGSHEVQLSYRFGKEVKGKIRQKRLKPQPSKVNPAKAEGAHKARYQITENKGYKNTAIDANGKRFLISIKSFTDFSHADAYQQYLKKRNYDARIHFDKNNNTYHVYISEVSRYREAKNELKRIMQNKKFRKAKIIQP
ncbi:MAG: PorP/SprF family type IX secretion system membrane protein [Cytophagales bacterium]|nr:PorP/SprF family type IX secretion system membrane protein [Cytophagales bacterium]